MAESKRERQAERPRECEGESERDIEMGNIEGTKRDQETPGGGGGEQDRKREQKRKRKRERRGGDRWKEQIRACYFVRWVYVRAGKADVYMCVRVCAVCRNQWKRVEEAAWQERTVG